MVDKFIGEKVSINTSKFISFDFSATIIFVINDELKNFQKQIQVNFDMENEFHRIVNLLHFFAKDTIRFKSNHRLFLTWNLVELLNNNQIKVEQDLQFNMRLLLKSIHGLGYDTITR